MQWSPLTCCASDGGRPSGVAVQAEIPNHRKLRWSRAKVVSVAANGPLSAGQVCDEKTNMCGPLLTHRNGKKDGIGTGVACYPRESQASRPVTAGPTGARKRPASADLVVPGV